MLLSKAFLALAWAATAAYAIPVNGYENMDDTTTPDPSGEAASADGGLQRFELVTAHVTPGYSLARSSAPYYVYDPTADDSDGTQKITKDTIKALKAKKINHVISANSQANNTEFVRAFEQAGIAYTPIPVRNWTSPTEHQFQQAWEGFQRHRGDGTTLVWCGYGHGRTGVVITGLQMYMDEERGQLGQWSHADYEANHVERPVQFEALDHLRQRLSGQSDSSAPGFHPVDDDDIPLPVLDLLDHNDLPLPDLDDIDIDQLLAGNYTGIDCPMELDDIFRYFSDHSGGRRSLPRQVTPAPVSKKSKKESCDRLREIVQKRNVPLPCRTIRNIRLIVSFANENYAGSWDDIGATLEGPAGKAVLKVHDEPSLGTKYEAKVDMQAAYKKDTIDIAGITNITLNAKGHDYGPAYRNDEFKVEGIQLLADCADPSFKAGNLKNIFINTKYQHPGGAATNYGKDRATVANFPVVPHDWGFAPPCAKIKGLSYEFSLMDVTGGGTWDTLSMTLGKSKEILLGVEPKLGSTKKEAIDLKKYFGKDEIDVRDLNEIHILDDKGKNGNGDAWSFKGLVFDAACARMEKNISMVKFANVNNDDIAHDEKNRVVWNGPVAPTDWVELVNSKGSSAPPKDGPKRTGL
ncbi:protein-tyrosine phosphatase [Cordyceps fumosorosea ARSEF 2679]|uniref:Protein-tyrosine phosphatase n=1 Tax=Cordyceps fumosorosea (strain ARSEF 2679) TaxID=1081104 RepID=A0A167W1G0_CORFA|nr:protein-tyrosine phosphatase [Cordyceps fumosorosea ARSEF 2679]OAA63217.1 protein-tyrosine phosphatase [Cordyceps fumosorosea ARSEF 2679]